MGNTNKNEREREYCENQLILQKNDKDELIHAGKSFVYIGQIDEYSAEQNYPGCLRSKCCQKKIRMYTLV